VIQAELDQPDFVAILVDECYKAGARRVDVEWFHQPLDKLHVRHRTLKTMSEIPEWERMKFEHRADTLPCRIYLESSDPDGLAGMNQEKHSKALQARYKIIKPIRDRMENKYQWCIAAVPGAKWAKKIFPDLPRGKAIEALWEAILSASRVDDDPSAAWDRHNENFKSRCDYLNGLGIETLHYTSSNGTDLTVGMIPQGIFCGGGENTLGTNVYFNPNIPTEEIFTSPMRGKADGIVYATKPLSYRGELIEDFSVRFENGRAVEVKAKKGEELLKKMISMDEGASYLGECALVPFDSPISNSGILFYNTLFDENAACHLALGRGFTGCLRDYEKYTLEEAQAMGINDSQIHEDFMIGSEDLSIVAHCANGRDVQIFKDGNWAF
jgi:aminopeptidase